MATQTHDAMQAAYKDGQTISEIAAHEGHGIDVLRYLEHYDPKLADRCYRYEIDAPLHAAYCAGRAGSDLPTWTRGWRFGAPPADGRSINHREGEAEYGVSMMAVDDSDAEPDGTYAIFNARSDRVVCEGWLVTHATGSDGEPMMVGVQVVAQ